MDKLLKFQINNGLNPKRLKQDIITRWNSIYYMLERFTELEESIRATVATLNINIPIITVEEWQFCRELCEILSPFEKMTSSISVEKYMSGSSVIVITKCLQGTCDKLLGRNYMDVSRKLIIQLKQGLEQRFKNLEWSNTFSLCTLLDPRYKQHAFDNPLALSAVKEHLKKLIKTSIDKDAEPQIDVLPSTNQHNAEGSFDPWSIIDDRVGHIQPIICSSARAIKEMDMYLQDSILPRNDTNNSPLKWWKQHQHVYPNIFKIFRSRCNVVATSVPCERVFSKTGYIIGERRTNLESEKVEMLAFLNANMKK